MRRFLPLLAAVPALIMSLATPAPSAAQGDSPGRVDVVSVRGVIDDAMVDFVLGAVEDAVAEGAQAVILQVDSPGAVTARFSELVDLVSAPLLPVVVWVGEAPASATGAAARLAESALVVTAAPGAEIGWSEIETIGGPADDDHDGRFTGPASPATVEDPRLDTVQAAPGQIVVWLDGREVPYAGGTRVLETAEEVDDGGTTRLRATAAVQFVGPGLWVRFLQAPLEPVTLVFLLSVGLAVVVFEFYALGPGLAAASALIPLLLAAYGLASLPLAWWALALVLGGILLMVVDYQAGAFGPWSVAGGVLLAVGGRYLVDGAPLLEASWTGAVLSAVGTTLFFAVAMPVVARNRFSTGTFGRTHLVGRTGSVVETFSGGAGVVEVDGARWRATAHRESPLPEGAEVRVAAIQGMWLEVDPSEHPTGDLST